MGAKSEGLQYPQWVRFDPPQFRDVLIDLERHCHGRHDMDVMAVVDAAFALIDDVYNTTRTDSAHKMRRRRFSRPQQELEQLRVERYELQQMLAATKPIEPCEDASDLASLWAHVASRQRYQRAQVLGENALLREAARCEYETTTRVAAALTAAADQLYAALVTPAERVYRAFPMRPFVAPILDQRLDLARDAALAAGPPCHGTRLGEFEKSRALTWTPACDATQFHFRAVAVVPFQLSAVAREVWTLLLAATIGAAHTVASVEADELARTTSLEVQQPLGRMEIHGPTALRRSLLPDGSVLLACASVSTGPISDKDNVMAGFEMHETVCIRFGRLDNATPRSPVWVEIVNRIDVQEAAAVASTDLVGSVTMRLQRLQAFAQQSSDADGYRTFQELENRLLAR